MNSSRTDDHIGHGVMRLSWVIVPWEVVVKEDTTQEKEVMGVCRDAQSLGRIMVGSGRNGTSASAMTGLEELNIDNRISY